MNCIRKWKMNYQNRIVNLLMIARKAGKLMLGFDMVSEALKTGKAAAVVFSGDASERTKKEVLFLMKHMGKSVPCYTLTEYTKEELGHSLGKMTAVLAVCDEGFSGQIAKLVSD